VKKHHSFLDQNEDLFNFAKCMTGQLLTYSPQLSYLGLCAYI